MQKYFIIFIAIFSCLTLSATTKANYQQLDEALEAIHEEENPYSSRPGQAAKKFIFNQLKNDDESVQLWAIDKIVEGYYGGRYGFVKNKLRSKMWQSYGYELTSDSDSDDEANNQGSEGEEE
jgi:hypothetical protein